MKTASAKAKGRRLQKAIRDQILEAFPELEEDDVRSTSMGAGGVDIQLSPAAQQKFGFAVEAKNQERLNIWSALEQAEENADELVPLVVFKRNRSEIYCAMKFDDLLELLGEDPS